MVWNRKKDFDKAIADCTEAIRLAPRFPHSPFNRGIAWLEKREYRKAIEDFTRSIELNRKLPDGYYWRGRAWYATKEYGRAIADYNEAIQRDPEYADTFYYRGLACRTKRLLDNAIIDFTEAIRLDGENAAYYVARADVLSRKAVASNEQAIEDYGTALKLGSQAEGIQMRRFWAWAAHNPVSWIFIILGAYIGLHGLYSIFGCRCRKDEPASARPDSSSKTD
jgi:tetratricopeptide (TPR) repeat protein